MPDMSYANAGQPAPAPGSPRGWGWMKAILDFVFSTYNGHKNNVSPQDQHLSNAILASDANRPLTTIRALNGNTLYTETDMMRHMWLELVDADFVPANFIGKVVPITLLTARNNIRGGLGTGDGTGIPGTTAPNVNPSTIPWRDVSGFIPTVIGAIPLLAIQELLVQSTAPPSAAVLIRAGSYSEQGTGIVRGYGGGTLATLAAPGGGLERYDAVYLIANPSGLVVAGIVQGVAASVGAAGLPIVPDGACLLANIYMNGTTNTVYNQSTIAGQFAPAGASYILEGRVLRGGGAPADASLSMTKIKEFAPRPTTPPSLTVTVLGGGYFNSSNAPLKYAGSSFAYNGAANAALLSGTNPSLPAAGFARFDGVSVDLATNLLTVTPGVPSNSGAETEPAMPTAGRPVGYVHVTATTTAIYSSFAAMFAATGSTTQGFIDDFFRMGAGGGSSGGTLTTITPAHVVSGNDATYQDGFLAQASPVVTPNLPGYIQPTGSGVQIIATQANPVKVSWGGVERRYPNPTDINPPYLSTTAIGTGTATASGAAGYRYLVADKSVAGVKTFGITIMTALPTSPDQALLAPLWWDGANLVTVPDLAPLINIDSALVNKRGTQVYWQGQTNLNSTSLIVPATMPTSAPFIVPPNTRIKFKVHVKGLYNPGATPAAAIFQSWLLLDGVTQIKGTQIDNTGYSGVTANTPLRETIEYELLAGPSSLVTPGQAPTDVAVLPGQHTVTWGYIVSGTATFDAYIVQIQVDIMHAGGN